MYKAHQENGYVPLVSEAYGGAEVVSYYAVAVVPASMCSGGSSVGLASLAGKRSCHTGYGRTAGWTMPVGRLAASGAVSHCSALCHWPHLML
jgi:melanoma-associated antigen p97